MERSKLVAFSIGPLASAALGLLTIPVCTWIFPKEQIALLAIFQLTCILFVSISSLGQDQAFVRHFHSFSNKRSLLIRCATPGLYIVALITTSIALEPQLFLEKLFDTSSNQVIFSFLLASISLYADRFLAVNLRMNEQALAYSICQIFPKIIFITLITTHHFLEDKSHYSIIIYQAVSWFLGIALQIYYTGSTGRTIETTHNDFMPSKGDLLRFGLPLSLASLAYFLMTSLDRYFLNAYSSKSVLATYSVSVSLAGAGVVIQQIISTVWHPIFYKWNSSGGPTLEKQVAAIKNISGSTLTIYIACIATASIFGPHLVKFLPTGYEDVALLLPLCLLPSLFYTLSELTSAGINITNNTKYSAGATILSLLVAITFYLIFVPRLGALGAAISCALAFLVFFALRTELSCRLWRSIPRSEIYILSAITTLLCISQASLVYIQEINVILWLIISTYSITRNKENIIKIARKK